MRGARRETNPAALETLGSSPRMRGAPGSPMGSLCRRRIIPADAGSTIMHTAVARQFGDHPRGCGEHVVVGAVAKAQKGSSPRMRGARCALFGSRLSPGIIPADAGSTIRCFWRARRTGDHPRGCGEHTAPDALSMTVPGSSPRMRGALTPGVGEKACNGIIPADAGSTPWPRRCYVLAGDHPRGCGEHLSVHVCVVVVIGSSPRMRGARERPG